ncbi:hypothetical protein RSOLAG1IB_09421 [Rhizoctonia solani AG-1 IB]|uniref:Uncharacterized protein n=1 Tax=Thanatephorus cucumeris (strain AG1-IB / isolate 7/3/14) TaxID=1108050 RepID=M5C6P0_THACB|nr:hypothetical protein BN14_08873 [Rhizoctonia solani AG-1 IB]CEL60183.1 hypothetical protein RSOLAG1IB_09421 [Rhizoctonia solani AG-1 IB]
MSEPPVMTSTHASVLPGGGPAPNAAPGGSRPPIFASRPKETALTREVLEIKERLMASEDEVATLRAMVTELQSRDEKSQHERDGNALRLKQAEAQINRLEAITRTYMSSQGLDLNQLESATMMSELVVDKKGHDLSAQDSKDLSKIIKESLASLYGVVKFSPKEHGGYPKLGSGGVLGPELGT